MILRRFRPIAIGALLLALGVGVFSEPASAGETVGCYAQQCEGLNPYAGETGCIDDAVLASVAYFDNPRGSGRSELWYSPGCATNWAVTRIYTGPTDQVWAGVWVESEGRISGNYDVMTGVVGYRGYIYPWAYTAMIDGTTTNCAAGINEIYGSFAEAEPGCR